MSQVGSSMAENMMQTPTGKFSKQWPEPKRFPQFLDKFGKMMSEDYDWSADIAKLPMPVLLVFADNDSVSHKHVAEFFALLGGGLKEPGWLNTELSKSRLAVVSGYSHYNFITSMEVPQIVGKFLADPLSNPTAGAAVASQAAPAPKNSRGGEPVRREERADDRAGGLHSKSDSKRANHPLSMQSTSASTNTPKSGT